MAQFRKKPVVIEAVQFIGQPIPGVRLVPTEEKGGGHTVMYGVIETLEGEMAASIGDWIITGVKGEKCPCKPDIFAATYEPVKGLPVDQMSGEPRADIVLPDLVAEASA